MCTFVLLRRPAHPWPILIAANRDEMNRRPWRPPARHWPDRSNVVAGLDETAGGTWLGLNDEGVCAAILNRHGTLGPAPGKRSRGELVLDALDHADAVEAARALALLDGTAYRPFNMVIADNRDAWYLRHSGREDGRIDLQPIPEGLFMLTAFDPDDEDADPRIRTHRPHFEAATPPDPENGNWATWQSLLGRRDGETAADERGAMTFLMDNGFGTVSSSLVGLPAMDRPGIPPRWLFAPGPPDTTPFTPVDLT